MHARLDSRKNIDIALCLFSLPPPLLPVPFIITQASRIYEETDFDGDTNPDMIHFGIQDIRIEASPPAEGDPFANNFLGVQTFLDLHSQANYSDYCLSYRFTHRDFDDGVVGLAYVAGVNSRGELCVCVNVYMLILREWAS